MHVWSNIILTDLLLQGEKLLKKESDVGMLYKAGKQGACRDLPIFQMVTTKREQREI